MDPRLCRMMDACANRAREALRVLEDVARFGSDHRELAAELKSHRHELRAVLASLDVGAQERDGGPVTDNPLSPDALARLAWRDTPGDVGVTNKTAAESDRRNLHDIVSAAAKRGSEALRSLEECAKVLANESTGRMSEGRMPDATAAPAWQRLETIRYRLYTCEQQLLLSLGAAGGGGSRASAGTVPQWRLCVLVTESLCTMPWLEVVRACLLGGADCIQLREKSLTDCELLERARTARHVIGQLAQSPPTPCPLPLGRGSQTTRAPTRPSLIINDRVDLALLSGADGVHLGQDDLSVRDARRLAGSRLLVGVSTHSIAEAKQAAADGADYCGVGAMFSTTTKARETSGVEYLRAYLSEPALVRLPHLAIGGITPANLGSLVEAGCRGVAVSSVVCDSPDPRGVCEALVRALTPV